MLRNDQVGLSPLARGTLAGLPIAIVTARFIPANAGNTQPLRLAEIAGPVYTR